MSVGYDKRPVYQNLLFGLTLEEMVGLEAQDRAKPHHTCTLHGVPVWTALANDTPYLAFAPANPDWLDCPQADTVDLNFIAGNFSLGAWVKVTSLAANRMVFCRGLLDTDGWHNAILMDGSFALYTNQAAANQVTISAVGAIVINNWYLMGISRTGASVFTYLNGSNITTTVGAHTDPLTSARELHIGIYDNEVGSPFSGGMAYPRIWGRALPDDDWQYLFETERHLYGV